MANKAPAFQLYAQDFLTGCTYLTNEEVGMYIKMLCKQWTDGNVPKKRLGFLLGLEWVSLSDELKGKFIDMGDFVVNERLEKEREKKQSFREKQAENGKKGGRPRKENPATSSEETQNKPNPFKNQKPNINQKKPLEEEDRNKKIEVRNKGKEGSGEKPKKEPPIEIMLPFDSELFRTQWQLWKVFRLKEHKFQYKTEISQQAALQELNNLAGGDEKTAIEIIHQSMAKGWKGFFELKNKSSGKQQSNSGQTRQQYSDEFQRKITEGLQS